MGGRNSKSSLTRPGVSVMCETFLQNLEQRKPIMAKANSALQTTSQRRAPEPNGCARLS